MENKQIEPKQAFEILYQMTGTLQLNRQDAAILDGALRSIAQLLPVEQAEEKQFKND